VEEFKKWAQKFEEGIYTVAEDNKNWNQTVGQLLKKSIDEYRGAKDRDSTEIKLINALADYYRSYYENEWGGPADKVELI
jgi:hypothetical protein